MIMYIWLIVPILFLTFVTFYLHKIVSKAVKTFTHIKKQKRFSVIATVVLMLPIVNIFGIWTIFLLHVVFISAMLDLLIIFLSKFIKGRNKVFIKIYYSRIIPILLTVVVLIYGYSNMKNVVETDYTVHTEKTMSKENYKIALLADLHFGVSMDLKELQNLADKIEKKQPDIVVLAGDIIDGNTKKSEVAEVFKILGGIHSNYGVYYVYGNHDDELYENTPEKFEKIITSSGITILDDSSKVINDDLILIGRANRANGDPDVRLKLNQLMKDIDKEKELILIDHQPCDYGKAQKNGIDLILSGHTHAGQIWPLGAITKIVPFNDQNYGFAKSEQLNQIVTSGIAGWGYPIRTEKHSEYVIINLKSSNCK